MNLGNDIISQIPSTIFPLLEEPQSNLPQHQEYISCECPIVTGNEKLVPNNGGMKVVLSSGETPRVSHNIGVEWLQEEPAFYWAGNGIHNPNKGEEKVDLSELLSERCARSREQSDENSTIYGENLAVENSASRHERVVGGGSSCVSSIGNFGTQAHSGLIPKWHRGDLSCFENCLRINDGSLERIVSNLPTTISNTHPDGFACDLLVMEYPRTTRAEYRVQRAVSTVLECGFDSIEHFFQEYFALGGMLSREI